MKTSTSDPHRFGILVRDSTRLFRRILRPFVEQHGLSFNQYLVLREVYDVPGINQRLLSGNVGIAEPTIVATVDALAKKGLVVRERSQVDRRQTHLSLTPAGRTIAARCVRRAIAINAVAASRMSARQAATLRTLLVRANESLAASLAEQQPPVTRNGPRRQ